MIVERIFYNEYMSNKFNPRLAAGVDYSRLNSKVLKKVMSDFYSLKDDSEFFNSSFMANFVHDLQVAINSCGLTEVQERRLKLWMLGYNESEIAKVEGCTRWVVSKSLHSACDKIIVKMVENEACPDSL